MRVKTMMAAVAMATMLSGVAQAQTAPEQGQYQAALERIMSETTQGRCPADVMAPELLAACAPQIAQMAPGLQSLGAIESITFLRAEGEGAQRVEFYAVKYAIGVTLTWGVGGLVDGKYTTAFAQNG